MRTHDTESDMEIRRENSRRYLASRPIERLPDGTLGSETIVIDKINEIIDRINEKP